MTTISALLVLGIGLPPAVFAASEAPAKSAPPSKAETAKADENRKKPLQRCDELKDKAQLECLRKARERIVEARAKREAKGDAR